MSLDLSGLTALLTVAEKRSFTAAAAVMRVTPSAVSQTIRALEERVGVRLLQRTTRSVGLTEAGARFVARLGPAVGDIAAAFESLGELRDRPAGVLRLSVPRIAYQLFLAPRLPAFLAAYPDISLDVDIDDGLRDIVAQGFDAGVRIGEMVEREMIAVRLGPDLRTAIVGSPAYFARRAKPKHPRELHAHDCINYRRRSLGVVYRWELTDAGKDVEIAVDGRLLLNDGELMIDAALAGLGLAYVLDVSVREHLASKRLVRVLDGYCPPFPGFYLYYPSRAHLAPKLQALVDWLRFRPSRRR
jgi:DNA-binding transcriptional LysR family regulator